MRKLALPAEQWWGDGIDARLEHLGNQGPGKPLLLQALLGAPTVGLKARIDRVHQVSRGKGRRG